ncbi:DUF2591 family protein [Xenorhabdus sp. 42]|uniref:phage protein NinX family protein n=1 Tax=Xenorhabdus szentirmaii TaxID=290112 RepID=UPI0019B0E22D|nr:phage protein NinX family protein [Xenorhabdus sp. 42]MBD2822648.1 DUF2591 family protein [Xenorhabdus sp. 42]
MKLKTSELTGRALDFSVAQAIGMDIYICGRVSDDEYGWIGNYNVTAAAFEKPIITVGFLGDIRIEYQGTSKEYSPSTDWSQCGHLIEKYKVKVEYSSHVWLASCKNKRRLISLGRTPQIAICRAVIDAQIGSEIDIPDELLEEKRS